MSPIPLGGLATGLDTNSLIDRLLEIERRPLIVLQTQKLKLQAKATAYQDLNTKILGLKYKAEALRDSATFFPRSVTSSAEAVATATAGAGSTKGTYTVTVTALAKGSIAAAATTKSSLTSTVATASGNFTFKLGASGTEVTVALTATTTLEQLVTDINAKAAGVTAAAVNTGTSASPAYKLTLTSNATGSTNNIVIVTDGTTLSVANTQTATDAAFTVTGLGSFTRATNTFSDAIDGVTITLKTASGSADLAVDYDKTGLQSRVQNLVDAYNDVVRGIDSQTATTKGRDGKVTSGAFTGDATTRQIRQTFAERRLARVKAAYQTLADIGVTTQKDGTLALDGTKFQKALADNPQGVNDLLAGPASSATSGIADTLAAAADAATKALTGTIAVRQDGISQGIKRLGDQIDAALARIDAHERSLRAQFNNLEQVVASLQSTGTFLTSQLKGLQGLSQSSRS